MSEVEKSDQLDPSLSAMEPAVNTNAAQPAYVNFCRVMGTPEEMVIDFGLQSEMADRLHPIHTQRRIALNFFEAKRLAEALRQAVTRHEEFFGPVEIDSEKRLIHPGM